MSKLATSRLGLLAGSGQFPVTFADAARRQGFHVHAIGIAGMASQELAGTCHRFVSCGLGRVGKAIRTFRRAGIDQVVMAGKIDKTSLLRSWRILRLCPDWRALHLWFRYACRDKKDDTLLLAVVREFERDGITFHSALDFCPELLVNHGFLTRRRPSPTQWRDIKFGWQMAKEIGRLDIGQTVIVRDTAVLAVEAIEGTDAAIRRAGELCRRSGFTVIKVAKPQQDMRFDVPTVGIETIQTMVAAGGLVLAIESDRTILLDSDEVIELADRLGITIVALKAEEVGLKLAS